MRTNLVYSIQITDYPREQFQPSPFPGTDLCDWRDDFEPEGWREHCIDLWGEHRPFFWPSQKKMYRSRSSARDKQAIVEHWGGKAVILVAEVGEFRDVEEVAAERVRARRQAKIDKLQAQIDALEADDEA